MRREAVLVFGTLAIILLAVLYFQNVKLSPKTNLNTAGDEALAGGNEIQTLTGTLEALHVDDFQNPENSRFIFYINSEGRRYEIVSDRLIPMISGIDVRVRGIVEEDKIIVSQTGAPLEILSIGLDNPSEENLGPQKTLVIISSDGSRPPFISVGDAWQLVFNRSENTLQDFYDKNSYGLTSLVGGVYGPYNFSYNTQYGVCDGMNILLRSLQYLPASVIISNYSRIILYPSSDSCTHAAYASVGKWDIYPEQGGPVLTRASVSWNFVDNFGVSAHELGHNFGSMHTNSFFCFNQDLEVISSLVGEGGCRFNEYGDPFSLMGSNAWVNPSHHTAAQKFEMGWFDIRNIVTATNGSFILQPQAMSLPIGTLQMLRLPLPNSTYFGDIDDSYYTIEYKVPIDYDSHFDPTIYNSIIIRVAKMDDSHLGFTYLQTGIIVPSATSLYEDKAYVLQQGRSYTDKLNGYNITLINIDGEGAHVKIERLTPSAIYFDKPFIHYDFIAETLPGYGNILRNRLNYSASVRVPENINQKGKGLFFEGDSHLSGFSFPSYYIGRNNQFTVIARINPFTNNEPIRDSVLYDGNMNLEMEGSHPVLSALFEPQNNYISYNWLYSETPVPLNRWGYISGVFNGTHLLIYINKNLVAEKNVANELGVPEADLFVSGIFYEGRIGDSLYGIYDDLKIYAKALNKTEIISTFGPPDILLYYPFDELVSGTPSVTPDQSFNNYNGIVNHVELINSIRGNVFRFSPGDYVKAEAGDVDLSKNFTLSGWIKMDVNVNESEQSTMRILDKSIGGTDYTSYSLLVDSSNKLVVRFFYANNGTSKVEAISTNSLQKGKWYFVTATLDGGKLKLYINGTLVKTTNTNKLPYNNNDPVMIGSQRMNTGAYTNSFYGSLDDIRIYNRALNVQEIRELYLG